MDVGDVDRILMPPPFKRPKTRAMNHGKVDETSEVSSSDDDFDRVVPWLDSHPQSPLQSAPQAKQVCLSKDSDCENDEGTEGNETSLGTDPTNFGPSSPSHCDEEYDCDQSVRSQEHSFQSVTTRFRDIVGHGAAKLRLDELLLPLALPPQITSSILRGVRCLPASILLYGPPGCGKTQLARAIAGESRAPLLSIGPSDVLSKFVGESEATIRSVFNRARVLARRSDSGCAVLFFDEIDALGYRRDANSDGDSCSRRVLAEILIQLTTLSSEGPSSQQGNADQTSQDDLDTAIDLCANGHGHELQQERRERVLVVAATNRPEECDPALLRRFAIRVFVGLPCARDRKRILAKLMVDFSHSLTKGELRKVVDSTEGWSGSELESLAREAAMAPIRECLRSAAIKKRKARKLQQKGGDESSQEASKTKDENDVAREVLLKGFQDLRPVSMADFEKGIAFFLGNHEPEGNGISRRVKDETHYDSSSSSDSDAE